MLRLPLNLILTTLVFIGYTSGISEAATIKSKGTSAVILPATVPMGSSLNKDDVAVGISMLYFENKYSQTSDDYFNLYGLDSNFLYLAPLPVAEGLSAGIGGNLGILGGYDSITSSGYSSYTLPYPPYATITDYYEVKSNVTNLHMVAQLNPMIAYTLSGIIPDLNFTFFAALSLVYDFYYKQIDYTSMGGTKIDITGANTMYGFFGGIRVVGEIDKNLKISPYYLLRYDLGSYDQDNNNDGTKSSTKGDIEANMSHQFGLDITTEGVTFGLWMDILNDIDRTAVAIKFVTNF